jgi:NAD(P)-dependent dehydrogenase (short-subunit alcohol dehydrogenase family)
MGDKLFDLKGQVAAITGGGGILCGGMARMLAERGVKAAVMDLRADAAEKVAQEIRAAGGEAIAVQCDVLNRASVEAAAQKIMETYKRVDILINGAGGNSPKATTGPEQPLFDLPLDAMRFVFDINFVGTFLCSQVFGKIMVQQGAGNILNISSMNAIRPLTKIPAYSAAKASVSNFTQWLAVHLSQNYPAAKIRVNAIAPGFFLTDQNRFLLTQQADGSLTPRGNSIISHTPQGRFGTPEDLYGTVIWLLSPASEFVHGVVIPVDGGFSAFSGV